MGRRLAMLLAGILFVMLGAGIAQADSSTTYQATYVEPVGGPNGSPFECPPMNSCGWASISGIGHSDFQVVTFNACGFGCHHRLLTFEDGSTLLIQVVDKPSGFAFNPPGNAGHGGYIGFPGLQGNPQFLEIEETILTGTGRFEGATGSGGGSVRLHGGVAIAKTSGTINLP